MNDFADGDDDDEPFSLSFQAMPIYVADACEVGDQKKWVN